MHSTLLDKWINLCVFSFGVTVLSVSGHGGQVSVLFFFTMLYVVVTNSYNNTKHSLNNEEKTFVLLVLIFWGWNLFGVLVQPDGLEYEGLKEQGKALDRPSRWLLLLPVFFLLRRFLLDWRYLAVGISVGVFPVVGVSVHQIYVLNADRAYGIMNNAIPFGEIMTAVVLITTMLMLYAWNNGSKRIGMLLFSASIAAFYGSLLAASRGAWIAYVLLIIICPLYLYKNRNHETKLSTIKLAAVWSMVVLLITFATLRTSQYENMQDRSTNEMIQLTEDDFTSSFGIRLRLWALALEGFQRYPFGVGTDNFREIKNIILEEDYFGWGDYYNQIIIDFGHAHNEWINLLVENGVQGLLTLFLLFGFVLRIFWKNIGHKNELVRIYSSSGLLLLVSYFIFGQTQGIFSHHSTTIFCVFYLFLFCAQIQLIKRESL